METLVTNKAAAHVAALDAYREAQRIIAAGKQAVITAKEFEDDRSLQQNRHYFGVILKAISEQARTPDQWAPEAWHELYRRLFLGYSIKKHLVAGRKKTVVIRSLRSTRDLTVKQFAEYVEKITAHATTDLGVVFPEEQR